ncbi:MAG: hypothetical protein H7230_02775 [Candidatus Parcubacteria bacterium]|nr:hypothetical protein [Candidatus Paceibacterota bacterium]
MLHYRPLSVILLIFTFCISPFGLANELFKSQMSRKKFIINYAQKEGGYYLPYNKNWDSPELINAPWIDDVAAVIMPPTEISFIAQAINNLDPSSIPKLTLTKSSGAISSNSTSASNTPQDLSNLFKKPFDSDSIWNKAIPAESRYSPRIGFRDPQDFPNTAPDGQGGIGVDEEPIALTTTNDPLVSVYQITDWANRCNGAQSLNKKVRVPAGVNYKDPRGSSNTPNYSGAFVQPDGSIFHFNAIASCGKDKIAVYDYTSNENDRLNKRGNEGGHGGSGLSGIGGSIRKGELISNDKITHAIKLNVFAKYYLYADPVLCNNPNNPSGFQAPANRADSYAGCRDGNRGYRGQFAKLKMGALTALPKNMTAESLGLTNPIAKKLFQAFQDYGGYIVDDSGWNHYDMPMELGVQEEVQQATGIDVTPSNSNNTYYQDMIKVITELREVIPDNTRISSSAQSSQSQVSSALSSPASTGVISSSQLASAPLPNSSQSATASLSSGQSSSLLNISPLILPPTNLSNSSQNSPSQIISTSAASIDLPRTGNAPILWGLLLTINSLGLIGLKLNAKNSQEKI